MTMLAALIYANICILGASGLLDGLQTGESARISNLENEVQQLQASLNHVTAQLAKLNTQPVAFTAMLTKTVTNLGSHQIVVFDHVTTNLGNGYNNLSGQFTAPVDGVYAFFITIMNMPRHSASVHMMKNGRDTDVHLLVHGFASDDGNFLTSNAATTIVLQAGDSVWVQNEEAFTTVEEINGGYWSSFSGHLVK